MALLDELEHPHIVRVLDLCEDDDSVYVVMELMRNGNLMEVITKIREKSISYSFHQAIARIMADKVYTSAEFKRERDNFQVNKFL